MTCALLLSIHFHEPRYHGAGAWPPAPMRLFQALVAGAAEGASLPEEDRAALAWLEGLPPPEIVAPPVAPGQRYINYVPNNDADAGKDPTEAPKAAKTIQPVLFEADAPLHYLWAPIEDGPEARRLCALAKRLHHLGRGVDPAWCHGRILAEEDARAGLAGRGIHHRPSGPSGQSGAKQAAPIPGTLRSLERRFSANREKFKYLNGKRAFSQPPKPVLREVSYDAPPDRVLYDIRDDQKFVQVPPRHAVALIATLLKGAAARLTREFPDRALEFERLIIGRNADAADKLRRVRLIPLPSIGSAHADRTIRRVLLEIPQDCPIRRDTLIWAFDGLAWHDSDGEALGALVQSADLKMRAHYEQASALWQTEIPAALGSGRRRLGKGDTKPGPERLAEEDRAIAAVSEALRHAEIAPRPTGIEVRREPFSRKGARCNDVEPGRFDKHALWHVRLRFGRPVAGPLVIGDGRFAGLGVMSPVEDEPDVLAFRIVEGLAPEPDPEALAQALRRATMARVQAALGPGEKITGWFTGHEDDGTPLKGGAHNHLAFVADLARERLLIIAPHCFDPEARSDADRYPRRARTRLGTLQEAMQDFTDLRAGGAGRLSLRAEPVGAGDPLFARATQWESVTPFAATRHPRRESVEAALIADALRELDRRGLPGAEVEVTEILEPAGKPLARLRLRFATAQAGPILLGRTLHKGGGVFGAAPGENDRPT